MNGAEATASTRGQAPEPGLHARGQELLQMDKDALIVLRSGIAPVRGKKIVYYRSKAFRARLQPPPDVAAISDSAQQARRIQAIALEVASLRGVVEDIRARVIERPMSDEEAAGEVLLGEDQISLALEDVDMAELPGPGASEAEVRRFMRRYAERASGRAHTGSRGDAGTPDLFAA